MTIEQFRSHDVLPGRWAKELATNEILQIVLSVMEDNHPARYAIQGDNSEDVSPTRAAIELGLTKGYSKYGDTLRILSNHIMQRMDAGEPTYEKPQIEEEQNA